MIYITGDLHGELEVNKFSFKKFIDGKSLTKNDYVIICGDFGLIWDGNNSEKYWLDWLNDKPWTTLFIDGNHENFELMNTYPIEIWNGGKIQKIRESVIHLMRGQIFEIDGKTFFTMGGAKSSDKKYRKEGLTWWKEEEPSKEEKDEALLNLEKYNNKVNYIITHTCPTSLVKVFDKECYNMPFELDRLSSINSFFDELIELINFDYWYFGHYHCDIDMDKFNMVFDEIKLIK